MRYQSLISIFIRLRVRSTFCASWWGASLVAQPRRSQLLRKPPRGSEGFEHPLVVPRLVPSGAEKGEGGSPSFQQVHIPRFTFERALLPRAPPKGGPLGYLLAHRLQSTGLSPSLARYSNLSWIEVGAQQFFEASGSGAAIGTAGAISFWHWTAEFAFAENG